MFKHRPSKIKYLTTVQTVDELHKNFVFDVKTKQNNLPMLKNQLTELKTLSVQLEKMDIKSTDDIRKKALIKTKINDMEIEIKKIDRNSDFLEYVGKTGDLLINYYDTSPNIHYTTNLDDNSSVELSEVAQLNVVEDPIDDIHKMDKLKHLNQLSQKERKLKKPIKKRKTNNNSSICLMTFFNQNTKEQPDFELKINRATIQDKYLTLTNKNYTCEKSKIDKKIMCKKCIIEKTYLQSDGSYVCKQCGDTEYKILEIEAVGLKDTNVEKQKYPYKKINHLKEKLNQFQSKESIDVPDDICNIVKAEMKKQLISIDKCTPSKIRNILKKNRMTIYYEHLQQIYGKITGKEPIILSREVEECIINMFQNMQTSFSKHCPVGRSNFLNYSYVLNKMFCVLGLFEHAKYFPLLKSKEKLREQDNIWQKICKDLGWSFYSSF